MTDPAGISLADLGGPEAAAVLAGLRREQPVGWVPVLNCWLVTGYDLAVTVMRNATTFTVDDPGFSTAQVVGPSMLSLDGPAHLRHRRPFGGAFRASQVADRFGSRTSTLAGELVATARPAGVADLRAELAGPLSVGVVTAALGLAGADAGTVLRWYAAIVGAVTDITAGLPQRPVAATAMADLAGAVHVALDRGGDSLLASAAASLSPAEITSNAAVLMFGGIDTTEGMITNALLHVLRDGDVVAALRADHSGLAAVVEESLRLEPAASVVDRYATADITLAGAQIRSGDLVRVSLLAANRDPAIFPDPDTFDPTRPNLGDQLAFARGPHSCLAMDLARLETRAALTAVLDGLPGVRLAGPVEVRGLVFRKPDALPVRWDRTG